MIDKSKMHLLPPAVADIGEQIILAKKNLPKDRALERIEYIRDYCEEIISKYGYKKVA